LRLHRDRGLRGVDEIRAQETGKAVLKAGHKTKSKNMVNLVREALTRAPRVKKASRGTYTV